MSVFDSFFPAAFASARDGAGGGGAPPTPMLDEPRATSGGCGCGCSSHGSEDAPKSESERALDDELAQRSLNRWTLVKPGAVAVFQDLGLDACCGGDRSLTEACRLHGLDLPAVLARLDAA